MSALRKLPEPLWLQTMDVDALWSRFHVPRSHELIHVLEGQARIDCGSGSGGRRRFEVRAGDTFVIPAATRHRDVRLSGSAYRVTYIFFRWPTGQKLLRSLSPRALTDVPAGIKSHLRWLVHELESISVTAAPAAGPRSSLVLLEMLLCLARQGQRHTPKDQSVSRDWPAQRRRELAQQVERHLVEHCHEPIRLDALARQHRVSTFHLCRTVRRVLGMSVGEVLSLARVERAKRMLLEDKLSIKEVSRQLGFSHPNYLSRLFRKVTGMTPTAYQLSRSLAEHQRRPRKRPEINPVSH